MKKTSLLSLLTATAIVAASAGTYAAWDQMNASNTAILTLREPVAVTNGEFNNLATTTSINVLPEYTSTATFTVQNAPTTGYKITPKAVVKDGNTDVTANFTVSVVDGNVAEDVNGSHAIAVTITPKDNAEAIALAGKTLNVEVTGTLEEKS